MTALNKRWVGTTSDPTLITNWAGVSLVNANYSWTLSGTGTANYYLRTAGSANPGISTPGTTSGAITGNDVAFTTGTPGSLAVSSFGYGDTDTLGYNTIYVRLADGTDPDTKTLDYVKLYQVPVASDNVRLPVGSSAMVGYDFSSIAWGEFIVEDGYSGTIGTAILPLSITCTKFDFSSSGIAYINLAASAIAPDVRNAASGSSGTMGLYLKGSALTTLTVLSGTVGVAQIFGDTATVATVRVTGGSAQVYLSKNVTNTTTYMAAGKLFQNCNGTTANIFGGQYKTEEAAIITTVNADNSASLTLNATGTIGTLSMPASYNGTVDMSQSSEARTITTCNQKGGSLLFDDTIVTITTDNAKRGVPQRRTISAGGAASSGLFG